jgi:hypothetical protein
MIQDFRIEEKMKTEGKDVVMPASMLPVVPTLPPAGKQVSWPVWEGTFRGSMIGQYSLPKHEQRRAIAMI